MAKIWTDDVVDDLIGFVDAAVEKGMPKMQAYEEFCHLRGSKYKPSTAAVQYSLATSGSKDEKTKRRAGYTKNDDRLIILASHFAPQYGLKKRDTFRVLGEKFQRDFRAIEQRAYLLTKDMAEGEFPSQCPDDIAEFLEGILLAENERPEKPALPSTPVPAPVPPVEMQDMDVVDALSKFVQATSNIDGINAESLLKQLSVMATMAASRSDIGNALNELAFLRKRCERLEKDLRLTRQKNELLIEHLTEFESQLSLIKKQQEVVDFVVSEFASIRTIEQVGALKDFTSRFRTEVDRMGIVIKTVDEWKEKYAEQLRTIYAGD